MWRGLRGGNDDCNCRTRFFQIIVMKWAKSEKPPQIRNDGKLSDKTQRRFYSWFLKRFLYPSRKRRFEKKKKITSTSYKEKWEINYKLWRFKLTYFFNNWDKCWCVPFSSEKDSFCVVFIVGFSNFTRIFQLKIKLLVEKKLF